MVYRTAPLPSPSSSTWHLPVPSHLTSDADPPECLTVKQVQSQPFRPEKRLLWAALYALRPGPALSPLGTRLHSIAEVLPDAPPTGDIVNELGRGGCVGNLVHWRVCNFDAYTFVVCSKVVHILHEYIALKTDILYRLQAVACLITRTCFYSFFCLFCTSLLNLHNSAVCQNSNRPTDYAKQSINQVWLVPINTVVVTSYSPVMLLLFNSVGGPPPQGRATLRNCFSVCPIRGQHLVI